MLTPDSLAHSVDRLLALAQRGLEKDGFVPHLVFGLTRAGDLLPVVGDDALAEPTVRDGCFTVPGQLRDHADDIGRYFAHEGALAALELSEYWAYPADDLAAARAYVEGRGIVPSAHPRRVEGIMASAIWPSASIRHMELRRIVRRGNSGAYLREWTGPAAEVARLMALAASGRHGGQDLVVTSWLDFCLPLVDPR